MIWAFVDYENVGSLESLDLKKYQRLIVFCGPRHRKLNLGDIPTTGFCHLELIRMASTGNNNLDFHLAFYLGVHHLEAGNDVEFHVISNDKGFDGVIEHLSGMGRLCSRLDCVKKKTTPKVAKKIVKKATKKVVKKAVKATAKKVVKKAVTTATQKTGGKIVPHAVDQLEKVVAMLNACPVDSRPNIKEKLINWVANQFQENFSVSGEIVRRLQEAKIILDSEDGLKYHLSNEREILMTESVASEVSATVPKKYPYSSLEIAQAIKSLGVNDRPRSLGVLEPWIMGKLDVDEFVARGIYKKLIREKCILLEDDWISYSFDDAC